MIVIQLSHIFERAKSDLNALHVAFCHVPHLFSLISKFQSGAVLPPPFGRIENCFKSLPKCFITVDMKVAISRYTRAFFKRRCVLMFPIQQK